MDLFKAEVGCRAGLGGSDVAAHYSQIEEQPELKRWQVAEQLTQPD